MTANEQSASDRPKRWHLWGKRALIGLALLIVAIPIVWFVLDVRAESQWERFVSERLAVGAPLTFDEIDDQRPEIPNDANSAIVIEAAMDWLEEYEATHVVHYPNERFDQKWDFAAGLSPARLEEARQFVSARMQAIEMLEPIRRWESGRFEIDYTDQSLDSVTFPVNVVSPIRALSKLIHHAATLKVVDGDLDEAMGDVLLGMKLSRPLNQEPSTIARLIQMSLDVLARHGLEDVLRGGVVSKESLDLIDEELQYALGHRSMHWAFLGERALTLQMLDQFGSEIKIAGGQTQRALTPFGEFSRGFVRWNQMEVARRLELLMQASDDPIELLRTARELSDETAKESYVHFLANLLTSSLDRAAELHVRSIATARCARAIIAAERFRMDTGALPRSLADLVPNYMETIPIDPFDGQPLRFKSTEQGILIYSIKEDGVDDGGEIRVPPDDDRRAKDTGWELLRVEQRGVTLSEDVGPEDP